MNIMRRMHDDYWTDMPEYSNSIYYRQDVQRPTLESGSTGEYVTLLQSILNQLNYLAGSPDGRFGLATQRAVSNFQRDEGLQMTGIVNESTWEALDRALDEIKTSNYPIIKEGSTGVFVKEVQLKLANLRMFFGAPDGIFGKETKAAVINFQKSRGLVQDGVVGALTWRELNRAFSATETPMPILRPTIKEGDSGEDVRLLQDKLRVLGYFNKEVDGIFDKETTEAVKGFQRDKNLEQNGIVNQELWEILGEKISPSFANVKEGDTGEDVIILQEKLKELNYYPGTITGSFGPDTTNAVTSFEKDNNLDATGEMYPEAWDVLIEKTEVHFPTEFAVLNRPTLRQGDSGDYVKELQTILTQLMFYTGPISGTFDSSTTTAVKTFQTTNKLTADGIVGRSTWSALIYLYSPLDICEPTTVPPTTPPGGGATIRGIVIDAGHGGTDPGAVGNGIVEKEYTLKISQYMANRFRELGVPVTLTRSTDETLSLAGRTERMLAAYGKYPDVIMISNHLNAGGGNGAETIYALRNKPDLARGILESIGATGQLTRRYFQRTLPDDPTQDYYYVIRNSKPLESVIVEYGFLDHPEDAVRIKKNWDIYAEAAVKAIMNYINMPYTAPSAGKVIHVVRPGDTLFSIAALYNTTVDSIKALNNLTSNIITIGQQLIISGEGKETQPPSGNIVYVVKAGDTLFSIANKFDTTVEAIRTLNNLTSNALSIGQQLFIPGVSVETPETSNIVHTVVAGDTLYSIASRYNTTVEVLKILNNLTSNNLTIGQRLLVPRPSVEEEFIYTVQAGDTLFAIAQRFRVSVEDIRRANNLASNVISVGQQLIIPTSPKSTGLVPYTVQSGDTLYGIANRFGVSVNEIMSINNLTTTTLSIGQQLLIPS